MPSGFYADVKTFVPNAADAEGSLSSVLTNADFDTDLTGWNDDSTGWSVDSGALIHTPGQAGQLTQDVSLSANFVYFGSITVSGMNAGFAEIYDDFDMDITVNANGTYKTVAQIGNETVGAFYIFVSEDFDGRIESVEYARVTTNQFPSALTVNDFSGAAAGTFSGSQGALFISSENGVALRTGHVQFSPDLLATSYAGYGQLWNNKGFLLIGDTASIPTFDTGNGGIWLNSGFLFIGDPANIPTSDPGPGGGVWNDGGTLKIA